MLSCFNIAAGANRRPVLRLNHIDSFSLCGGKSEPYDQFPFFYSDIWAQIRGSRRSRFPAWNIRRLEAAAFAVYCSGMCGSKHRPCGNWSCARAF